MPTVVSWLHWQSCAVVFSYGRPRRWALCLVATSTLPTVVSLLHWQSCDPAFSPSWIASKGHHAADLAKRYFSVDAFWILTPVHAISFLLLLPVIAGTVCFRWMQYSPTIALTFVYCLSSSMSCHSQAPLVCCMFLTACTFVNSLSSSACHAQAYLFCCMQYSPLTANDEHAPVADLSRGEGQHDYEAAQRAGLDHPNAKASTPSSMLRHAMSAATFDTHAHTSAV